MKVAIIGGGASGTACAIALKQGCESADVTVFERLPRILKKLLVTGNGRCNLTNANSSKDFYRGETELVGNVLARYSAESNKEFFENMGLVLREEAEGRIYPMSGNASSVVNCLLSRVNELGVKIVTDTKITDIKKQDGGFILNSRYYCDKLVIATGGCSAAVHGSDGSSFKFFDSLGVSYIKPEPALTGVIIKDFPRSLKGVRCICNATLVCDGKELYAETGEVQFNDFGLSGIPVMQLSGLLRDCKGKETVITLDCAPSVEIKTLKEKFILTKNSHPEMTAALLVGGVLSKALGNYVLSLCEINENTKLSAVTDEQINDIVNTIKDLTFKVEKARGFEFSQVTSGGVGTDEINPETLELKKLGGIYVCGEAVNADGLCGGHNLQWAWSSGRLCADSIIKGCGC